MNRFIDEQTNSNCGSARNSVVLSPTIDDLPARVHQFMDDTMELIKESTSK